MALPWQRTLTTDIIVAMISGAVLGIIINLTLADSSFADEFVTNGAFRVVGAIFVAALKMLVVPLVLVSLVCGVTALSDVTALGRIGAKAIGLYMVTTAIAITIALTLATIIGPGKGLGMERDDIMFEGKSPPSIGQVLIDLVPANPIAAMADGNMLQVIVFALILGVAITFAGSRGETIRNIFTDLNEVIMKMVGIVMALAPYGVFCLIARTFATQGLDAILPLASYFFVVVAALLVHSTGTYSLLIRLLAGLNPITFLKKMRTAMLFAFSTASSNATIPITLRSVEQRLGADNAVASFTVPLGATINMDGTAIMQGVATVFIANVFGVDLGLTDYLLVILTATLASIGTAGVPGVGLIMLAMVLEQVGLPVEGIALIIGVDRLLDMMRTAVNITGDATVTCIVARTEKAFDEKVFADPKAGMMVTS